jgi:hypothetical protein
LPGGGRCRGFGGLDGCADWRERCRYSAGVDVVVGFLGALVGAVIGAYSGVTAERLRGEHELTLQRRREITEGMLAINEHAAAALRICADLQATDHWPALYGEDWRELRAKQLPGEAADILIALARVELFLSDASILEQRVDEYFDILMAPDDAADEGQEPRLTRAAAAHTALKHAIRDELERATAGPRWTGRVRGALSRLVRPEWRGRASSYLGRRGGD